MRLRLCLMVVLAVLAIGASGEAQMASEAERWIGLVERHQPGVIDEPLLGIAGWDGPSLARVLGEARDLFRRWDDVQRQNRLLLAGAAAHADVAMLTPERAARLLSLDPRQRPSRAAVGLDGEHIGTDELTAHWEFARRLLDRVEPDSSASAAVRLWYQATAAYFIDDLRLAEATPHLERGRRLFPADAQLLMFSGAVHEAFSSPLYQAVLQDLLGHQDERGSVRRPDSAHEETPGGEAEELRHAERYLRSALAADPLLVEARIRLGRVLGRRGRHHQAVGELKEASTQVTDRQLRYYSELFLGAEEAALGRLDVARGCFERASALQPCAQAPVIALSDLARRSSGAATAGRTVALLAALPGNCDERADPWWAYHRASGRKHEELLAAVRALVRSGHAVDGRGKATPR